MSDLRDKKIILGITGSIAAYKSCFLIRQLVKAGCDVKCVVTKSALDFVGRITLSTLSKNELIVDLNTGSLWTNHVELGLWADAMLIAPASANTLAKAANGICDNALLAIYLSAKCPVYWAPSMDLDMWAHPATQSNIDKLIFYGNEIIPVGDGELASGLIGKGRMAEVEDIMSFLEVKFS
jgi:phosphopantothenoylcysteine decarboxylase / phosphopantothenate---cysteine ligase